MSRKRKDRGLHFSLSLLPCLMKRLPHWRLEILHDGLVDEGTIGILGADML